MIALIISLLLTSSQNLHFFHKGVESGLSQVAINGLYQDENGVLWVGTKEGVKYYEGTSFYSLSLQGHSNWVMSNRTPTVCGDGRGSVFITFNYSVFRHDLKSGSTETLFTEEDTTLPPEISICSSRSGLWTGCRNRIYKWDHDAGMIDYLTLDADMSISALAECGDKLYVGTKKKGLFSIDLSTSETDLLLQCNEVMTIYPDCKGRIWCGTLDQGVFCLNQNGGIHYSMSGDHPLSDNYVRAISEDFLGRIWIGTSNGLDILNPENGEIFHCGLLIDGRKALSNLSVWSLLKDKAGTMWIGSYYGGLDYCTFEEETFQYENFGFNGKGGPLIISDVAAGKGGTTWISTEGAGLIKYEKDKWKSLPGLPFSKYNIKDLLFEKDSTTMWISTHMGGLWKYNTQTEHYKHYTINEKDISARSECNLYATFYKDHILIGTLQGLYWMNPQTGQVDPVPEVNRHVYEVDKILVSKDSTSIWIVGSSICRYNPANGVVEDFSANLEKLGNGVPITSSSIIETDDGSIYIGTVGSGLLKLNPENKSFEKINPRNSAFPSEYIGSIYPTQDGRILLGTSKGLCWYNPADGFADNFDSDNGFPLLSMLPGCISECSGNLFLGGVNGMVITTEKKLRSNNPSCRLYIARMAVNGSTIEGLRYTDRVTLPHYKNNLTFTVSTDDPARSSRVRYMYKLEGLEKDWNTSPVSIPIRYSNLKDGNYVLRISSLDTDRDQDVRLRIKIRPPFYASWYALSFYVLLLLGFASFVIFFITTKIRLTSSLALERQKMRFFANMSHELRTPLTLLLGRLELFREKPPLNSRQKSEITAIYNVAHEMAGIVNDQMVLLKMTENALKLAPNEEDLVAFTKKVVSQFKVISDKKGIRLDFISDISSCKLSFDSIQMKRVFNNLLSNALKFTPSEKGHITVSVKAPQNGVIRIAFQDNGIGIEASEKERVFERFYQTDNPINRDPATTGTGIGLFMASNIVSLHGGTIELDSTPGKGSTFTVCLPAKESETVQAKEPAKREEAPVAIVNGRKRMLLVEDDDALRQMLKDVFKGMFEIFEAPNGKIGFELAEEHTPDLIISDIMMPVMSGDEFCRKIKSNFSTSHIPVILLTALADIQHNIMGYDCGADDYVTKPFNSQLLIARCSAILNNRELLQKKFSSSEDARPDILTTNNDDAAFINKVVAIIEDNILDKNVSVSFLCDRMAMGHTKLFNKIKGLTGSSPQELILNVKVKFAARMLKDRPELNVSDIAFQLGYNSLNYFGKCFKKAFGQSPTEYRKNHKPN